MNKYRSVVVFSLGLVFGSIGSLLYFSSKNSRNFLNKDIEIKDVSYYCPNCHNTIYSLSEDFCSKCGIELKIMTTVKTDVKVDKILDGVDADAN